MSRIRFEKTGRAKFLSHLDLMRTMQRVFVRAGLAIKHSEGFNPHPQMVFALPLPVGTESVCELMDFKLLGEADLAGLPEWLNRSCPEGIRVLEAYEESRKFKEIKWLDVEGTLFYDGKVCDPDALRELFSRDELIIEKKTKRSTSSVDVIPLIDALAFEESEAGRMTLRARLAVGEPALSPAQLISAIGQTKPELMPDHAAFRRVRLLDAQREEFR